MKLTDFTEEQRAFIGRLCFEAATLEKENSKALREAATDFARLVFVERWPLDDMAAHRSYRELREAIVKSS